MSQASQLPNSQLALLEYLPTIFIATTATHLDSQEETDLCSALNCAHPRAGKSKSDHPAPLQCHFLVKIIPKDLNMSCKGDRAYPHVLPQ